ncbi:hypothetical protein H4S06_002849 [Coemansia sp. BCRC 34490]|nr:hypothetical protein H4S06_002849 [Coemansia sp. BCRC 34490]
MTALGWTCCVRRTAQRQWLLLVRRLGTDTKTQTTRETADSIPAPVSTSRVGSLLPGQILVGPPHPVSNIRPVRFYVPSDETPAERAYREIREQAVDRDHEFWLDNNTRFEQGKAEFERSTVASKGECTIDDLSDYFKQYQVDSFGRHLAYNRYVWRRNLAMVWPALCAWFHDIRRRRRRRVDALARHSEQSYFDHQPGDSDVAGGSSVVAERIHDDLSHNSSSNCATNSTSALHQTDGSAPLSSNESQPEQPPASRSVDGDVDLDRRAEKIKSYY